MVARCGAAAAVAAACATPHDESEVLLGAEQGPWQGGAEQCVEALALTDAYTTTTTSDTEEAVAMHATGRGWGRARGNNAVEDEEEDEEEEADSPLPGDQTWAGAGYGSHAAGRSWGSRARLMPADDATSDMTSAVELQGGHRSYAVGGGSGWRGRRDVRDDASSEMASAVELQAAQGGRVAGDWRGGAAVLDDAASDMASGVEQQALTYRSRALGHDRSGRGRLPPEDAASSDLTSAVEQQVGHNSRAPATGGHVGGRGHLPDTEGSEVVFVAEQQDDFLVDYEDSTTFVKAEPSVDDASVVDADAAAAVAERQLKRTAAAEHEDLLGGGLDRAALEEAHLQEALEASKAAVEGGGNQPAAGLVFGRRASMADDEEVPGGAPAAAYHGAQEKGKGQQYRVLLHQLREQGPAGSPALAAAAAAAAAERGDVEVLRWLLDSHGGRPTESIRYAVVRGAVAGEQMQLLLELLQGGLELPLDRCPGAPEKLVNLLTSQSLLQRFTSENPRPVVVSAALLATCLGAEPRCQGLGRSWGTKHRGLPQASPARLLLALAAERHEASDATLSGKVNDDAEPCRLIVPGAAAARVLQALAATPCEDVFDAPATAGILQVAWQRYHHSCMRRFLLQAILPLLVGLCLVAEVVTAAVAEDEGLSGAYYGDWAWLLCSALLLAALVPKLLAFCLSSRRQGGRRCSTCWCPVQTLQQRDKGFEVVSVLVSLCLFLMVLQRQMNCDSGLGLVGGQAELDTDLSQEPRGGTCDGLPGLLSWCGWWRGLALLWALVLSLEEPAAFLRASDAAADRLTGSGIHTRTARRRFLRHRANFLSRQAARAGHCDCRGGGAEAAVASSARPGATAWEALDDGVATNGGAAPIVHYIAPMAGQVEDVALSHAAYETAKTHAAEEGDSSGASQLERLQEVIGELQVAVDDLKHDADVQKRSLSSEFRLLGERLDSLKSSAEERLAEQIEEASNVLAAKVESVVGSEMATFHDKLEEHLERLDGKLVGFSSELSATLPSMHSTLFSGSELHEQSPAAEGVSRSFHLLQAQLLQHEERLEEAVSKLLEGRQDAGQPGCSPNLKEVCDFLQQSLEVMHDLGSKLESTVYRLGLAPAMSLGSDPLQSSTPFSFATAAVQQPGEATLRHSAAASRQTSPCPPPHQQEQQQHCGHVARTGDPPTASSPLWTAPPAPQQLQQQRVAAPSSSRRRSRGGGRLAGAGSLSRSENLQGSVSSPSELPRLLRSRNVEKTPPRGRGGQEMPKPVGRPAAFAPP
eukprot:TRINITY_DN4738_c0_g1_i1.p1 TRINITY_DN4738_c0_g1~~TRINITY_DN4738_c0_g1_i1.p1  ORF type:complete len:1268 (-),score=314.45 TRINITY_DN4738_c0_g1_i1:74-3877(-)